MAVLEINWNPSSRQSCQFGLLLSAVVTGLAVWLAWNVRPVEWAVLMLIAAAGSATVGLLRPSACCGRACCAASTSAGWSPRIPSAG